MKNIELKVKAILVLILLIILGGIKIYTHQLRVEAELQLEVANGRLDLLTMQNNLIQKDINDKKEKLESEAELKAIVNEVQPKEEPAPVSQWVSIGDFKITYYGLDITTATATGKTPEIGKTIGVDPAVIPYGSQVMIDGQVYEAQDTGAYKGNLIDVLCESEAVSYQLGTHMSEVFIWRME